MLAVGCVGGDSSCTGARTAVCFTFPIGLQANNMGEMKNNTGRFLGLLLVSFNFCLTPVLYFRTNIPTKTSPRQLDCTEACY